MSVYTRSRRDRCFKLEADYGHCAAKDLKYYGFKLSLRVSRLGMITDFPLLPARPPDIQLLDEIVENYVGGCPPTKASLTSFAKPSWRIMTWS